MEQIQALRGVTFQRTVIPDDAVNTHQKEQPLQLPATDWQKQADDGNDYPQGGAQGRLHHPREGPGKGDQGNVQFLHQVQGQDGRGGDGQDP